MSEKSPTLVPLCLRDWSPNTQHEVELSIQLSRRNTMHVVEATRCPQTPPNTQMSHKLTLFLMTKRNIVKFNALKQKMGAERRIDKKNRLPG